MKKSFVIIGVILTMLFWAINFHVVKIALEYYEAMPVAAYRFFFASIVLIGFVKYQNKKEGTWKTYTLKEKWFVFLTGFFGIFLTIYFFNKGLETSPAVNSSLIISTSPLIVAVMAFFMMRQRISLIQFASIIISFLGVAMILGNGGLSDVLNIQLAQGDLYIFGMALVFSFSQIIVAKYIPHIPSIPLTAYATLISFVLFTLFSIPQLMNTAIPVDFSFWASIIFMGLLGTGVGYTIFYLSIVKLGSSNTTLYMNLIPLFTVLLAFPFGEKVYTGQLIGGLVVISGLLLFGFEKRRIQKINDKKNGK